MRNRSGQAALESAMLVPAVLLALLILLQPSILLISHMVMGSTAAEAVRLAGVSPDSGVLHERIEDLCQQRLEILPPTPLFHVGESKDWEVSIAMTQEGRASVTISHEVRLLPLVAEVYSLFSADGDGVFRQEVRSEGRFVPSGVQGDYGSWTGIWKEV